MEGAPHVRVKTKRGRKMKNLASNVRQKLELPRETNRRSLKERISFFGSDPADPEKIRTYGSDASFQVSYFDSQQSGASLHESFTWKDASDPHPTPSPDRLRKPILCDELLREQSSSPHPAA